MNQLEMITTEEMYLSRARHVIISIILLLLVGCKDQTLESIDVYSLNWLMTTQGNLNREQVKNLKGDELHRYKVTEKRLHNSIQGRTEKLQPVADFDHLDARMVCVLHYKDGTNEELGMAAGTQIIGYRGKTFNRDSVLIGLIEEQLEVSHIPIVRIERTLSVDDEHFTYHIIVTRCVAYIKTEAELVKALRGTVPETNGIVNVKQLSTSEWEIDTNRPSQTDNSMTTPSSK